MFTRSRSHIFVRTTDHRAVLAALDRHLRKWQFRRVRGALPLQHPDKGTEEVRELYWRAADDMVPWTCLAPEDPQNVLTMAYAIAKELPSIPVVVVRGYKYGDFLMKVYHERDCVLKVGEDADHELAWVGPPLERDQVPKLVQLLGANAAFESFLGDVLAGQSADAMDLQDGLGLPSLAVGYVDLHPGGGSGWTHAAWVHKSSRLSP